MVCSAGCRWAKGWDKAGGTRVSSWDEGGGQESCSRSQSRRRSCSTQHWPQVGEGLGQGWLSRGVVAGNHGAGGV